MKYISTFFLSLLVISLLFPLLIQAQQTGSVPKIDGKITESEWEGSKVFSNFYVTIPKSDEKFYDSTIVYVKQTHDAMYFAYKYWPKGKIITKSLTRDRSTEDENEFFIMLDLENKNQNGYFFSFSFKNNQRDALVYSVKNQSSEWDWVWENKATIYKQPKNGEPGYIEVEIKIPVDKLQNKNKKQIGFDLQLFAYKPDGNYYYYSIIPNSELLSLAYTYKFDLVTPFDEKVDFKFNATPYVVASKFNGDTLRGNVGGDIKVSLDKHTLKGTFNTDESTLEADPVSFNLYNRPTYLQEKRTFFSKDLDIYRSPNNLFYTREIDSINVGANYTYRSDALKLGALYLQDEKHVDGTYKNYFVLRPNFNGRDFTLGSMFLYTNDRRTLHQDRVLSVDGFYRFPNNPVRLIGQYATDFSGNLYYFYGYYQFNDAGGPYADVSYKRVDNKLDVSTYINFNLPSFVKNNYDEISVSGGYKFVFNRKYFSDINVNGGYYRAKTLSDEPFGTPFTLQEAYSINTNYKVASWLRFNQYFEYNRPNDFDENGNLITWDNTYQSYNANLFFGNNYFSLGYAFGPYFGTYLKNPYASLNVFLFDNVSVNASINHYEQFGQSFNLVNGRLDYRFLDKFYLRMFYAKNTQSEVALLNTLLQYEFFAGSNVYLVLNLLGNDLQNTGRYFKISYEFNF